MRVERDQALLRAAGFFAAVDFAGAFFAAGFLAADFAGAAVPPLFSIDFFSAAIRSTTFDAERPSLSSLSMILRFDFCLRLRSIRSFSAST